MNSRNCAAKLENEEYVVMRFFVAGWFSATAKGSVEWELRIVEGETREAYPRFIAPELAPT